MKSVETLPEQQGQSKTAVPHVSGQHDEQPDGERVTDSVYQGLMDARSVNSLPERGDLHAAVAER